MTAIIGFGVGASKTGTTSLAAMFASTLQVAHEPDAELLLKLVLSLERMEISEREFQQAVQTLPTSRAIQFNVSSINSFVIRHLYALNPDARYVLTVRNASSWLRSFTNHQLTIPTAENSLWPAFRELRFGRLGRSYAPEDEILRLNGLYGVDSYLNYWSAHALEVINVIPADQLCIVGTRFLSRDSARVAKFLGVAEPGDEGRHRNKGDYNTQIRIELDRSYLQDRVSFYSRRLLEGARLRLPRSHLGWLHEAVDEES